MRMRPLLLAGVLAAFALVANASDWADDTTVTGREFDASKAMCRKVRDRSPPPADFPDAPTQSALKGCSSEALYYGIGVKADPIRARQCALIEMRDPRNETNAFAGAGMLMTIYANGRGAAKDLDLATHMACVMWAPPVDSDTLVKAVQARKSQPSAELFDYCSDVNPGYSNWSIPFCMAHEERQAKPVRAEKLRPLLAGWSAQQRATYARLLKAEAEFIRARGEFEQKAGTINRSAPIAYERDVLDTKVRLIQRLAAGRGPRGAAAQLRASDRRLQATYDAMIRELPEKSELPGEVTRSGARQTQRKWIAYRDAWLALAAARWPGASREGLAAYLSDLRRQQLRCDVLDINAEGEHEKECAARY